MDIIRLAEEIIGGNHIHRSDDTEFFISADIKLLCKGADRMFVIDKSLTAIYNHIKYIVYICLSDILQYA